MSLSPQLLHPLDGGTDVVLVMMKLRQAIVALRRHVTLGTAGTYYVPYSVYCSVPLSSALNSAQRHATSTNQHHLTHKGSCQLSSHYLFRFLESDDVTFNKIQTHDTYLTMTIKTEQNRIGFSLVCMV